MVQSLQNKNIIVGQVNHSKLFKLAQPFDLFDHIVLQKQVFKMNQMIDILHLCYHIVLQIQRLQIDVFFKTANVLYHFVMQVQLVIHLRILIQSFKLT